MGKESLKEVSSAAIGFSLRHQSEGTFSAAFADEMYILVRGKNRVKQNVGVNRNVGFELDVM